MALNINGKGHPNPQLLQPHTEGIIFRQAGDDRKWLLPQFLTNSVENLPVDQHAAAADHGNVDYGFIGVPVQKLLNLPALAHHAGHRMMRRELVLIDTGKKLKPLCAAQPEHTFE